MSLIASRVVPQFTFNTGAQRFATADGRFVARETVKAASEMMKAQVDADIENVSLRFYNGEIQHSDWDAEMRVIIRRSTSAQATLACGGREAMTQSDWGRVGFLTKEQNRYLNGFGERIQSGYYGEELSKNGFIAHAKMYGASSRGVFEYVQGMNAIEDLGHDQVSNELAPGEANHCKGEGSCVAMTDLEWVFADDPRWLWPGQRLCLGNCQCRSKSRKSKSIALEAQDG